MLWTTSSGSAGGKEGVTGCCCVVSFMHVPLMYAMGCVVSVSAQVSGRALVRTAEG